MFCAYCGKKIDEHTKFCPFCGVKTAENVPQAEPVRLSHKRSTGLLAVVISALLVVLCTASFWVFKHLQEPSHPTLFYVSGDELAAVLDLQTDSWKDVLISEINNEDEQDYDTNYFQLSSDGSYLYFFQDVDADEGTGTLCRVAVKQLWDKTGTDQIQVEKIDTKVCISSGMGKNYSILPDNTVVYVRDSAELNWYDGEKIVTLMQAEGNYIGCYTNGEGTVCAIYTDKEDRLFAVEVAKEAEAAEIDDHVSEVMIDTSSQKDIVLYLRTNLDDSMYWGEFCKMDDNGAEVLLQFSEDEFTAEITGIPNHLAYLTLSESISYDLYDYVNDPYVYEDSLVTEPKYRDYMDEVAASNAISAADRRYYSDFEDFKESEFYLYDDSYQAWTYWNAEKNTFYYYDDNTEKWYEEPDMNAYQEAYAAYQEVGARISLREELKAAVYTDFHYKLYYYKDGTVSEICDNLYEIYSYVLNKDTIAYTKADAGRMPDEQYSIDDVASAQDLIDQIDADIDGGDRNAYVVFDGGEENKIRLQEDEVLGVSVSKDGKKAAVVRGIDETQIYAYDVNSGVLENEIEVANIGEGGTVEAKKSDGIYYIDCENDYGRLYCFDGEVSYLMAENILKEDIFVADDGTVCGFHDGHELSIYDENGQGEMIAEDVDFYEYLGDGCFLVMKEDDLYYINQNREEKRIARNVPFCLYSEQEKGTWLFTDDLW